MSTIAVHDMVEGYVDVVDHVMEFGREVAPRGANTREVLATTIVVPADAPMLPVGTGRKVSVPLAAVEALQVVGGYSDPAQLFAVNPHLREFSDQGSFHGAYGPRIRGQVDMVVRRLQEEPLTRRAVVAVWDPARDHVEGVHNYPCTTELQFMVREDRLDLHVTMRANDAWHGLAYDAFVFNQLQHTIARIIGRDVGRYFHHATSLHVYEEHWELTRGLTYPTADTPPQPTGVASFERARAIGEGSLVYSADVSEAWYIAKAEAAAKATA